MAGTTLEKGAFCISLDFELYWGIRDRVSVEQSRQRLLNTRKAVQAMLGVFEQSDVHVTWATVGMLFCQDREDLLARLPGTLPEYENDNLSPYGYLRENQELSAKYHFAPDLIREIQQTPSQEIATHTFSHYYCLEPGQTRAAFKADLLLAQRIALESGLSMDSLVFPRNQWNAEYLTVLKELGIRAYRGNEDHWIYKAGPKNKQGRLRRGVRLADAYFNLTGHHTHPLPDKDDSEPYCLPASRFLRPYSRKLRRLDGLRMSRIKRAMSAACQRNHVFHLWWHPHNFGKDTAENIAFLKGVIEHYKKLRDQHGMASLNMTELCP